MPRQEELVLEKILDTSKQRIYRICRIYAISPIEPQDLFQEVVCEIWKSLPSFKGHSSMHTWVYKIALNVCTRKNQQLGRGNKDTVRLESIAFELPESEDRMDDERYQALTDCMACLDEGDQKITVLSLEGLAYKEIAEVTQLTENHIAVKMKRIRKKLMECISPKLK